MNEQAEILERNHERFLKVLGIYKPPSKASLDKIKSGKIEIGGKAISIAPSEQTFVEKLSKRIVRLIGNSLFFVSHKLIRGNGAGSSRISMPLRRSRSSTTL